MEASTLTEGKNQHLEEIVLGRTTVRLISEEELISGSQQPMWLLQELFCDLKIKIGIENNYYDQIACSVRVYADIKNRYRNN